MMIPTNELPHLSLLVDDYLHDYGKVLAYYGGDFRDPAAYARQTDQVLSRQIPRAEVAAVLMEQNRNYGCGDLTLGRIEAMAGDGACAVVTGQQVGLFSGPLYTIYKALTAVKLSERLNRSRRGCFVPVFWLASDDHDLAEIDHVVLADKDNRLEEVRCRMPSSESKVPASKIVLPPDILDCIRRLKDLTPDSEFKTEVIDHLSEAYQPGRSYAEAFAGWMTRLFKSHGLLFIDPSHPRLKELGRDVFRREIAEDSPSTRQALAASGRLRQAGYEVQIPLHEGILNIFYAERERRAIQRKEGVFEVKGMPPPRSKEELLALAEEKPFLFSPNVLLRPLFQDALLPTVAYIAGPGEIAYFGQLKGVYESFRLPMPVIYPRKSATIVEKKVGHVLKKYDLKIQDIWRDAAGMIGEISKKQIPDSLQGARLLVLDHLERDLENLKKEIMSFEPTLENSVDLAKGKMNQHLKFLEKKIQQAAKKRNETAILQLRKAVNHLYPNQRLQERVFNIAPYLIKYGYAFMERLDQAIDIDEHGHQLILM